MSKPVIPAQNRLTPEMAHTIVADLLLPNILPEDSITRAFINAQNQQNSKEVEELICSLAGDSLIDVTNRRKAMFRIAGIVASVGTIASFIGINTAKAFHNAAERTKHQIAQTVDPGQKTKLQSAMRTQIKYRDGIGGASAATSLGTLAALLWNGRNVKEDREEYFNNLRLLGEQLDQIILQASTPTQLLS